ncbi:MAG: bifunctional 4-hydroxy-2-oxoglutarate aldolase/2-dehydro-3-deoxy-phosphogluconate aldolase [Porticoccaceae bacterium]|nr:bifunctional 4-hydroxy-2-oxoglutarate aldolase/2-dehydro-3-deoxy-phosphogluconate aldolase [Porticoccaceae bacterium]
MNDKGRQILQQAPAVPVISIHDLATAVPLAQALVAGGIPVLEVTLRTPCGLDAIARIKAEVEGAIVGAGTVLSEFDLDNALNAGSEFVITPGLTPPLLSAGAGCGVPFIPGIATASELMNCVAAGLDTVKFFPAEACGGVNALKALNGPFPDVRFCPTGGISPGNLGDYLAVPAVLTVGGSWLIPDKLVAAANWAGITRLAQETCALVANIKAALNKSP